MRCFCQIRNGSTDNGWSVPKNVALATSKSNEISIKNFDSLTVIKKQVSEFFKTTSRVRSNSTFGGLRLL